MTIPSSRSLLEVTKEGTKVRNEWLA